jgi:hypothetical protein
VAEESGRKGFEREGVKNRSLSMHHGYMPVVPATLEAKAGGSLEPRSSKSQPGKHSGTSSKMKLQKPWHRRMLLQIAVLLMSASQVAGIRHEPLYQAHFVVLNIQILYMCC